MNSVTDISNLPTKRPTVKGSPQDLIEENQNMKSTIEKLNNQITAMKLESQKKNNTIDELTKWVKNLALLNTGNYADAMNKINEGLEKFFFMQEDICELKKEVMLEKKRFLELTERYNKLQEEIGRQRREMMTTNEGMLVIEKTNLENTLKQLSEEVEFLSERNATLLEDLKKKRISIQLMKTQLVS